MKYFWNLAVILVAFLIQNSIVPYFKIFGVQPDLLLILIISFAFVEGPNYGSVNGFFGGLLQDLLSVRGFGIGMLSKTLVGYGSGLIERTMFSENSLLVAPAIAIATIISAGIHSWMAFLLGYQANISFLTLTLPQALYNSIIGIPIFLILQKYWDFPGMQGKEVNIG